jgi:hypothetical protein
MRKSADFLNYYFNKELSPLLDEIYEDCLDQSHDTAKNNINKFIYRLQELRRHLHDNNE